MSEDSQPQSNQLTLNGIIFIGAILVVANTELDYWKEINYQVYYYFIVFSLISSGMALFTNVIIFSDMLCMDTACGKTFLKLAFIIPALTFIVFYVFICMIWHHDPEHTILFYNEFWSELAFSVHTNKPLYYKIGDIIVRIYSTLFLIISFILPCIIIAYVAMLCSRAKEPPTTPSLL